MKKIILLVFLLTFSLVSNAQKKKEKPKLKKIPKVTKVEAAEIEAPMETESIVEYAKTEPAAYESQISIDTLRIKAGKKYVILVDINNSHINEFFVGSDLDIEGKELQKNFPAKTFEIIKIINYTYIVFENQQTIEVDAVGNSYNAMAYWSGNVNESIETQEGLKMATEFVSANLGENKESSYIINTRNGRNDIEKYDELSSFTEKSKKIMNAFLKKYSLPFEDIDNPELFLFNQNDTKIKTLESFVMFKNKKIPSRKVVFDDNGYPQKISGYSEKGVLEQELNFEYLDQKLIAIEGSRNKTFRYADDTMILYENVGEANETTFFKLKNNELVYKSYTIMLDDENIKMNIMSEKTIENNCETIKINNEIWAKDCCSAANLFPLIHTYTSFQDGNVLQFRRTKIVKKNETTFEKYYSSAEAENDKDVYKLGEIFTLNDKKLVSSIKIIEGNNTMEIFINYTY